MAYRTPISPNRILLILGGVAGLFLLASASLFLLAAGSLFDNHAFARQAERAMGEVIDYRHVPRPGGSNLRACAFQYPVFAFDLPSGERVEAVGRVASCPVRFEVGTPLLILYDPAMPSRAVPALENNYQDAILYAGIGLFLALAGAVPAWGWLRERRKSREAMPPRAWVP